MTRPRNRSSKSCRSLSLLVTMVEAEPAKASSISLLSASPGTTARKERSKRRCRWHRLLPTHRNQLQGRSMVTFKRAKRLGEPPGRIAEMVVASLTAGSSNVQGSVSPRSVEVSMTLVTSPFATASARLLKVRVVPIRVPGEPSGVLGSSSARAYSKLSERPSLSKSSLGSPESPRSVAQAAKL